MKLTEQDVETTKYIHGLALKAISTEQDMEKMKAAQITILNNENKLLEFIKEFNLEEDSE